MNQSYVIFGNYDVFSSQLLNKDLYEYEIESSAAALNQKFQVFVLCTLFGLTYLSHTINTVVLYNWLV